MAFEGTLKVPMRPLGLPRTQNMFKRRQRTRCSTTPPASRRSRYLINPQTNDVFSRHFATKQPTNNLRHDLGKELSCIRPRVHSPGRQCPPAFREAAEGGAAAAEVQGRQSGGEAVAKAAREELIAARQATARKAAARAAAAATAPGRASRNA